MIQVREHIVFKNTEITCAHCGSEEAVTSMNVWLQDEVFEAFIEEHRDCKEQEK